MTETGFSTQPVSEPWFTLYNSYKAIPECSGRKPER